MLSDPLNPLNPLNPLKRIALVIYRIKEPAIQGACYSRSLLFKEPAIQGSRKKIDCKYEFCNRLYYLSLGTPVTAMHPLSRHPSCPLQEQGTPLKDKATGRIPQQQHVKPTGAGTKFPPRGSHTQYTKPKTLKGQFKIKLKL